MDVKQDINSPNLSYNVVQQLVNQSQIGVAQLRINQEQNENQLTLAIGYSSNQQQGSNPIYNNGLNIKLQDSQTLQINTGTPDSNGVITNKNVLFDSSNNYYISNAIFYPQNIYSNQQQNSLSYQSQIINQNLKQITSGFLFNSNVIFDTLNQSNIKANLGTITYVGNIEQGMQYTSNGILQSSQNIVWDYNTNRLGINTSTPQQQLDVKGNIQTNQQNIAQQLVSTLSQSDNSNQAIILQNSNMIQNLNTQYFQGLTPDYFRNITNINNGILPVVYGGTGKNYISNGQIIFGQGVSTQTSSNLYWDNQNNNLGINTQNPQYTLDVQGNINTQGLLQGVGINIIHSGMIGSNLTVSGTGSINQIITNNVQVVSTITSLSNVSSNETVNSNLNVGNNLQVTNQLTSLSNLSSNSKISSNLTVGNTVTSQSNITTNETIQNNLAIGNQIVSLSNITTNETINSNLTVSNQLISTISTGISPFNVTSTTLVSNLNVQYLNGQPQLYYTNASNISSGTLNVTYGGTGINSVINGQLFYASNNIFAQTSNLYYTSNFFGINNTNPSNSLDVIGNTYIKGNLTVNGDIFIVGSNAQTTSNTGSTSNSTSGPTSAQNINGILVVANGGTGFNNGIQGQLLFGQGVNQLGQSSNLFWDSTNQRLGIRTSTPQHGLDVIGNIQCSSNFISSNQMISLLNNGTAPIQVSSTTLVSNLNVQFLNGQLGSYYTNVCNIQQGILGTSYGGTGISTINNGYIFFAQNNIFTQSSNLFWDFTNLKLGIKTVTPQYEIDVVGNIQCSSNFISSNQFVSLVNTGTSPIQVLSTTLVSNLNVQYLNGQISSYYTNATNIQQGTLGIPYGGTGITTVSNGYLFFASNNAFAQSSNLFWDAINFKLGIKTIAPQYEIDVIGNIQCSSNFIASNQLISLVTQGTSPILVSSTTLVSNLNVQYLNSNPSSYYTNASNISSGVLGISYGGTGINGVSNGLLFFAVNNTFAQSSNLYYNYTSNFLGINNSNPSNSLDVIGNTYIKGNLTVIGAINIVGQAQSGSQTSSVVNVLPVASGGTGLSNITQGYITFGQGINQFGQSSNLFWDSTNLRLGIRNSLPQQTLDVVGNINCSSNIYISNQLISTIAVGTSPLTIASTTMVTNLNAQYLNNNSSSYYTNASNISSGILGVSYGGTGINTISNGNVFFAQNSVFSQSSNLFWDSTNQRLGIKNSSPQQAIDVIGNIMCSSNIYFSNQLVSTVATGSAPFLVASTTLINNLNAQLLNSNPSSYYTNAGNISSGILAVSYGGTGLNQINTGYIPIGNGTSALNISSNLFFDVNLNNLGLGTTTPINDIHMQSTSSLHPIIGLSNSLQQSFLQMSSFLSIPQISSSSNGFSLGYTPTFTSNQSNYFEICRVNQSGLTTTNISFTNSPNFSSLYQFYYSSNQTAAALVQLLTNKAQYNGGVGNSFTFVSGSNSVTANYTGYVQFNCYIFATYNPTLLTTPTYLFSIFKNSNAVYQMSSSSGFSSIPLEIVTSCSSNDVFQMFFNGTNGTIQVLNGSVVSLKRLY